MQEEVEGTAAASMLDVNPGTKTQPGGVELSSTARWYHLKLYDPHMNLKY